MKTYDEIIRFEAAINIIKRRFSINLLRSIELEKKNLTCGRGHNSLYNDGIGVLLPWFSNVLASVVPSFPFL
jgi:hypothetical protein